MIRSEEHESILLAFQKTGILGSVSIEPFQCQCFILFERKEHNKTGRCLYLVPYKSFVLIIGSSIDLVGLFCY